MKKNFTLWQSKSELGIGNIIDILECPNCGHEIAVGEWNRTDGTGEYIDYNVDVPNICPVCDNDPNFGVDRKKIAFEIRRFRMRDKNDPVRKLAGAMAKEIGCTDTRYIHNILMLHQDMNFETAMLYNIADYLNK